MKKIITGKLYDTETAKELGNDYYSNPRDFHYWSETLYKKRTGEFFLYGKGGPASKYAESCGQNTWSGGEKIIPLSYKAAQEWAEEHLDADDYQSIFGDISEEGEDVYISVKLPAAVDAKVRRMASENGVSLTAMIISLIEKA
jgi:hypothetical protein